MIGSNNDISIWLNNLEDSDHEHCVTKGSDECQYANSDFTSSLTSWQCQKFYFIYFHKPTDKQHARN